MMKARNATASILLALSAVLGTACGAGGDAGHQAAAKYIGPFQGTTEVTFGGTIFRGSCPAAIELAQRVYDQEKDARLALKPEVEKYRNDDGFKEKFSLAIEMTQPLSALN